MEHLLEKTVTRKKDSRDYAVIFFTVLITIVLSVGVLFLPPPVNTWFPVFYLAGWYIAYRIITSRNVEYEYSFVDNALTVTRICGRRWRKQVFSASLHEFDHFFFFDPVHNRGDTSRIQREIYANSSQVSENLLCGVIYYDGKQTAVYLSADARMIDYIHRHSDKRVS